MSEVESIIFDKKRWTPLHARRWMKEHYFAPIKKVHKTKNFYRYRINNPEKYKRYINKSISNNGIKLIIGFK
jgi:hypothetical protein